MRLTGLDVQENQARRLLNDLDTYRVATDQQGEDEEFVAHDWLTEVFEPPSASVPRNLRRKLEPARSFHEILEHRWYLAEKAGHDIPMAEAVQAYVDNVLPHRPDEEAILGLQAASPDRPTSSRRWTRTETVRWPGPLRRWRATSNRATPAATPALSDSTADPIGIDAMTSHCSRTRRDSPLPSEPTTSTTGSVENGRSLIETSPPPSSPTTNTPAALSPCSVRTRLVTRATGTRAAAPADTFHADAVAPAARRSGTRTPCAPNAPADRRTAPRLRWRHAVERDDQRRPVGLRRGVQQVVVVRVRVRRAWMATPWCTDPSVRRSSSARLTSSRG